MNAFTDFNLLPSLQASIAEKELITPTDIQVRVIPALLQGRSVVGISETGSGKTLAFALPLLHMLKVLENNGDAITVESQPRAIVVVPTKELGEQLSRVFKLFTHSTRLRVRTLLGSSTPEVARKNISGVFEVLIATPGRLVKMLDRQLLSLNDIRILVFDEADQILDQGFLPDARRIAEDCQNLCQLALFSATISSAVQQLINELFSDAEFIRSKGSKALVSTLKTINCKVIDGNRFVLLQKILKDKVSGGTMIFTNTREQCDKLVNELESRGYACAIYRGEMDKVERRNNLKAFRDGKVSILVSTDLASRGLDIEHVGRVINYHLPKQRENYVHRVGRTARAGRMGTVINLVTERDQALVDSL